MKRQMFYCIFPRQFCFYASSLPVCGSRTGWLLTGSAMARCRDKKAGTHRMLRTCGRPDPCTAFASSGETAGYSSSVSV